MDNYAEIKKLKNEMCIWKGFLAASMSVIFIMSLLEMPYEERYTVTFQFIWAALGKDSILIHIHYFLLYVIFAAVFWSGIVAAVLSFRKKNYIKLFNDRIVIPSVSFCSLKTEIVIGYSEIRSMNIKQVNYSRIPTRNLFTTWRLTIICSNGKKRYVSYYNSRKERLFEIYDFIKERVPPDVAKWDRGKTDYWAL